MNYTIIWLVILVALIAIELATMGLTTVWFAAGSLIATIIAAVGGPLYLQIAFFFIVSVLLLYFTRPIAVKYFNKDRVRTNAEGLVGKQAIVTGEIDNLQGTGQVNLAGMDWSARSKDDTVKILPGQVVEVLSINGVKLVVEEKKEEGE